MASGGTNPGTSLRRICMNLASRSLYRAALLVALFMVALTAGCHHKPPPPPPPPPVQAPAPARPTVTLQARSEEHTSELQSQFHLVCRLLLEKKKRHAGGRDAHPATVGRGAVRTAGRGAATGAPGVFFF